MKKILILLAVIAALILSVWGYLSLRATTVSEKTDVFTAFPEVPCSILRINNLSQLNGSLLYNNSYWQDMSNLASLQTGQTLLQALDSLKDQSETVLRFMDQRTIYLSTYTDSTLYTYHLWSTQIASEEEEALVAFLQKHLKGKFYFAYEKDIFIASKDKAILEASVQQIKSGISVMQDDAGFQDILPTAGKQASANWFFNLSQCQSMVQNWARPEAKRLLAIAAHYARWCCFDVLIEGDKLIINGFAESGGGEDYLRLLQSQETGKNTLTSRMPYNTYFFHHLSLSNFDVYHQQMAKFSQKHPESILALPSGAGIETPTGETPLIFFKQFFGGEIAFGCSPLDNFVVISLYEADKALERLEYMVEDLGSPAKKVKNQGYTLFHLGQTGFAGEVFGQFYTLEDEYITIMGNKMIIAPTANFARYIASRNANTQTLQCAPNFRDANRTLLTESNLSMYANIPYLVRNAKIFTHPNQLNYIQQTQSLWKNFSTCCMQAENEPSGKTFQHLFLQYDKVVEVDEKALAESGEEEEDTTDDLVNAPVQPELAENPSTSSVDEEKEEEKEEVTLPEASMESLKEKFQNTPAFTVTLDAPATMNPQVVKNHYTGEKEIAIQDKNNQLYLINASGEILWKKQLDSKILGGISQVDLFKNNKLQMVFVTQDKLYVIDRNGHRVSRFCFSLPVKATSGLRVCDYESTKNYRYLVAGANKKIMLLKPDGSTPADWNSITTEGTVKQAPRHLRITGKDFILVDDENRTYFLSRKGQKRLNPESIVNKADNVQFYADNVGSEGRIVTSSDDGDLYFIYLDNEVKTVELKDYEMEHDFHLFKGNYGNYYIFFDKDGLDVYDKDLNMYLSDGAINGGDRPILHMSKSVIAAYDSYVQSWVFYNLFGKVKAYNVVPASTSYAYFGSFKPYKTKCLVTVDGSQVKLYTIKNK